MGDKFSLEQGIGSMVHAIAGPVIVFPNTGWEDTIPKWVFNEIQIRRLTRCMQETRSKIPPDEVEQALDIEALAYMYPATLAAPLGPDWTNIYCWLAQQCMMHRLCGGKQMKAEDFADVAPKKLSEYEVGELRRLKRWLWEKNQEQRQKLSRPGVPREPVVMIPPDGQLLFSFVKEVERGGVGRAKPEVLKVRDDGGLGRGTPVHDPGRAVGTPLRLVRPEEVAADRSGEPETLGKPQGRRGTRSAPAAAAARRDPASR